MELQPVQPPAPDPASDRKVRGVSELLGANERIDQDDFVRLLLRLVIDLTFAGVVIKLVYHRLYQNREYVFTYFLFNVITFCLCMLLRKVPIDTLRLTYFTPFPNTDITDDLEGNGGRDEIYGGNDNDDLDGGGKDDTLDGQAGFDRCTGGGGTDILRNCEQRFA